MSAGTRVSIPQTFVPLSQARWWAAPSAPSHRDIGASRHFKTDGKGERQKSWCDQNSNFFLRSFKSSEQSLSRSALMGLEWSPALGWEINTFWAAFAMHSERLGCSEEKNPCLNEFAFEVLFIFNVTFTYYKPCCRWQAARLRCFFYLKGKSLNQMPAKWILGFICNNVPAV